MIRSLRRGRSPNCSATGSFVGIALVSAVAGAAVLNAWADRFARWTGGGDGPDEPPLLRDEDDGAALRWPDPPATLFLDEAGRAAASVAGARVIGGGPPVPHALRAPTEVHLAVTDRCPAPCSTCYLDNGPHGAEADLDALGADLEVLAEQGVLEIAFGGGEALLHPATLLLARRVRALGMVPNLTTSGFGLDADTARAAAAVFGQVNVSIDGLGATYRSVRGWAGEAVGVGAVRRLVAAGARVGVNTVLTRANLPTLRRMAERFAELGVAEWQWLRLKPTGRARADYAAQRLDRAQAACLWPLALELESGSPLQIRVDCALVPFLAAHLRSPEQAARLGLVGCPGSHSLMTRHASGAWAPCSFVDGEVLSAPSAWREAPRLQRWRQRAARPPEPCASCAWAEVCRGGCRVVARHVAGDELAADPECPRVMDWAEGAA